MGQKQKTEKKERKRKKEERAKVGNNNGQLRIVTPPRVAHAKPPGPTILIELKSMQVVSNLKILPVSQKVKFNWYALKNHSSVLEPINKSSVTIYHVPTEDRWM